MKNEKLWLVILINKIHKGFGLVYGGLKKEDIYVNMQSVLCVQEPVQSFLPILPAQI